MNIRRGRTLWSLLAVGLALIAVSGLGGPTGLAAGQAQEPQAGRVAYSYAFTYQGYLEDVNGAVNDTCDFTFSLFDKESSGNWLGTETVLAVTLVDGLFSVPLDFGAAAHDGGARWLLIAVRCPAGTGEDYVPLSPLQALTAAPAALTLALPSEMSGSSGGPLMSLWNGGAGPVLEVATQSSYGLDVDLAGEAGVFVRRVGTPSSAETSTQKNGVEVASAEGNGLFVGRADVDGAMIKSVGGDGVAVFYAGQYGLYVGESESDGAHVSWAKGNGVRVGAAAKDGVYVNHAGSPSASTASTLSNGFEVAGAQGNGLYVGRADAYGVYVNSAFHGLYTNAGNVGLYVDSAGTNGIWVESTPGNGLYVATAADGVDVYGSSYAGNFRGNINVTGNCVGCLQAVLGVNAGVVALQPGDVVAIQGVQTAGLDNAASLWQVVPAASGGTVVGVVSGRAELETAGDGEKPRQGETGQRLVPRDGAAAPRDYVTIVISGPMRVRAETLGGGIVAGDRLAVSQNGLARALKTTVVDGLTLAESAPVLGIALDAPDDDGMVWVLVNPQ